MHDTIFYPPAPIATWTTKKRAALSHAILDWGGFAPLQPMFGSKSPYNSDEEVPIDSERMRKLLNFASQMTGRPDPSFETLAPEQPMSQAEAHAADTPAEDLTLAPLQARAWSLPPPPPDVLAPKSETRTSRPTQQKPTDGKISTATSVKAQKQMLAKVKKLPQPKPKAHNKGDKKAVLISSNKDGTETAGDKETTEKLTVDKRKSQSTPKERETSSTERATIKERLMGLVQNWF